jgi:hypothetical protein
MPWDFVAFIAACKIDCQRIPRNFAVFIAAFKRYYKRQSFPIFGVLKFQKLQWRIA